MSPETFTIFGNTMSMSSKIHFHYLAPPFMLLSRKKLKDFLAQLLADEGQAAEDINVIFCTDEYLLKVNQDYLKHDNYTDVITFQHSGVGMAVIADIYISVERVRENAASYKATFTHELHRVLFHGFLHLCGYKDKAKFAARLMRDKEDFYLSRYFVSRGISIRD